MNSVKVYPIKTEVKIKTYSGDKVPGVISEILIRPEISYKVVYWDRSERHETWINEFEIEFDGANFNKRQEIGFHS